MREGDGPNLSEAHFGSYGGEVPVRDGPAAPKPALSGGPKKRGSILKAPSPAGEQTAWEGGARIWCW